TECRKGINVEKPECVKWFDDLSKNNSSVDSTGQVVQTVSYNPSKPYDFYQQEIQVTPTDFPRMSGVVKMANGRLMAIDQQVNYIQSVSQNDCKKWLSNYRHFNYFSKQKNEFHVQPRQQTQQQRQPTSHPHPQKQPVQQ